MASKAIVMAKTLLVNSDPVCKLSIEEMFKSPRLHGNFLVVHAARIQGNM